ncbi:MAG: prevent-host-death protein [Rhodoferax sp.]|nr:prevent-host-death protein [Rhodoferax sp.]MBP7492087.1 prevent-host-death protein [Rhodoferax sp.]
MQVTATEAKNRFGYVCSQAKIEPVFVEKDGRIDSVILSLQQFEALKISASGTSIAQRQRDFTATHKAWIDEQNDRFDKSGLWCDDLRVW